MTHRKILCKSGPRVVNRRR